MKPTFGSLFAGIGGFDLGMEQAGWECKFQVEWDKHCRSVLDRHWPDVEKWGDIRNVDGRFLPPVDCIVFGSPCQDMSQAGKRGGLSAERSGLFHEAVRIIKEMRNATGGTFPRYAIWENVAGALSSNNGHDFATVINEMAKAGACLQEYALLDAQHFGIPQRRRRVFLASLFSVAAAERCPDPLLPVTESVRGDTKKSKHKRQSASLAFAESIEAGCGINNAAGSDINHNQTVIDQDVNDDHQIVGALAARDYKGVGSQYVNENKCVVETSFAYGIHATTIGRQDHNGAGGSGVSKKDGPMYTLTKADIHAVMQSESTLVVRRLTPLEYERLQGFPDDHTRYKADGTEQSDSARYKQCGNAVAVPVAKWVGEQLIDVHRATYPATPIG